MKQSISNAKNSAGGLNQSVLSTYDMRNLVVITRGQLRSVN